MGYCNPPSNVCAEHPATDPEYTAPSQAEYGATLLAGKRRQQAIRAEERESFATMRTPSHAGVHARLDGHRAVIIRCVAHRTLLSHSPAVELVDRRYLSPDAGPSGTREAMRRNCSRTSSRMM